MAEAVFIGLGSNVGDSTNNCKAAVTAVLSDARVRSFTLSSLYLTSPVSDIAQRDFVNGAVRIGWGDSPKELLALLHEVEASLGRRKERVGGPRTIDLDILLFDNLVVDGPSLTIPHPRLHVRKFALLPCLELDPHLVHPRYGRPLGEFLSAIGDEQRIEFLERIEIDEIRPDSDCLSHSPALSPQEEEGL